MHSGADGSGFQLGYARGLDGLRGISILLVMVVHLHLIEPTTSRFLPGGFLGVDIFFVLSGFLITSLLVSEHQASGSIRLSHFYLRRVLRLWPALAVVLLFSCVLGWVVGFSVLGLTALRIASTLFYFTNWLRAYESSQVWWLAHFWSLSIEEQFYLLWPPTLAFLLKRRVNQRWIILVVAVAICASAIWKVALYDKGFSALRVFYGSDTRADTILIGCLLGLLIHWKFSALQRWTGRRTFPFALLVVGTSVLAFDNENPSILFLGGSTVFAIATGILVCRAVMNPPRLLVVRPLVWLGKRAYGLYLWHWPLYEIAARLFPRPAVVPVAVALTLTTAALSYRLIELPFLRLKGRYAPHSTTKSSQGAPQSPALEPP